MAPKKKEPANEPADEVGDMKAAMENELVIAVLKSRLGRYQEAGEKLAVEGFKLTDELAKQKLTLQDINEFLTNELKARSVATTQLEERVVELSAKLQEVQKEAQAEVAHVKADAAAEVAAAAARVTSLAAQLEGSAEFLERREQLEGQLEGLKAALAAKQKEVDQKLSDLERRHLQEKERTRHDMAAKIRETKIAMAQLADQHLEGSTKRTLVENEAMAAELAYHAGQSSRLVAANNGLRGEAAELRRHLAVAHKTVESTARKNLLLQQTIKAILRCLQEEGAAAAAAAVPTTAAAAAAAADGCANRSGSLVPANREKGGAAAPAGVLQQCLSFAIQDNTAAATVSAAAGDAEQQQQQAEGMGDASKRSDGSNSCAGHGAHESETEQGQRTELLFGADAEQQQQQQQRSGQGAAAVAGDIVQQLEQRVLLLSDDLAAARQALAAAMQGLMPEGAAQVQVVINPASQQLQQQQHLGGSGSGSSRAESPSLLLSPKSPSARAARAGPVNATASSGAAAADSRGGLSIGKSLGGHNSSSSSSSKGAILGRSRSSSPVRFRQQQQQQGLGSSRGSEGFAGFAASAAAAAPVAGAAAMAAALEDGVAAFVLYAVQHLRRGSSAGQQQRQQFNSSSSMYPPSSPTTCSSPKGLPSPLARGPGGLAAAGGIGACRSVSPSTLGLGPSGGSSSYPPASPAAGFGAGADSAAAEGWNSAAGSSGSVDAVLREQLARLLLEQLHGYARYKVAAFQGMRLLVPEDQAGGPDRYLAQPGSAAAAAAAAAGDEGAGGAGREGEGSEAVGGSQAARGDGSAGGSLVDEVGAGGFGAGAGGFGRAGQHQLVLPPLPTLLNMNAAAAAAAAAGVASPASPGGGGGEASSSAVQRLSTEDLFGAVLSDVRPWGAAGHVGGSSNHTHGTGVSPGPGRSLTPTSPGVLSYSPQQRGVSQQRHSSPKGTAGCSGGSSAKSPKPGVAHHAAAGKGRDGGSCSSMIHAGSSSPSPSRFS